MKADLRKKLQRKIAARPPQRRLTKDQIDAMVADYAKGDLSLRAVARRYGVSHVTLSRYATEAASTPTKR